MIKITYKCKVLPLKLDCVLKQFLYTDQSQKGFTATVRFDTLQLQTRINKKQSSSSTCMMAMAGGDDEGHDLSCSLARALNDTA